MVLLKKIDLDFNTQISHETNVCDKTCDICD